VISAVISSPPAGRHNAALYTQTGHKPVNGLTILATFLLAVLRAMLRRETSP
jgi:hypothetical protein